MDITVFHFPLRPGDKHTTLTRTLAIWDEDEDEKDERGEDGGRAGGRRWQWPR